MYKHCYIYGMRPFLSENSVIRPCLTFIEMRVVLMLAVDGRLLRLLLRIVRSRYSKYSVICENFMCNKIKSIKL